MKREDLEREQRGARRGWGAVWPSEGGAATAPGAALTTSVALLAGHLLRDGELVLLILRPSRWFILLSSLKLLGVVGILMASALIIQEKMHYPLARCVEAGVIVMAARLMWGVLQWMGRLYVLTDMRILRLSGVFSIEIFDCALRRVARTLLEVTFKERLCRIGSIVIIPQDDQTPIGTWQMVAGPRRVHEKILATIARAKQ